MKINPDHFKARGKPSQKVIDEIWIENYHVLAKAFKKRKSDFVAAVKKHWQQHGTYPKSIEMVNVSTKVPFLVKVGGLKRIDYKTGYGRKKKYTYRHDVKKGILASDHRGRLHIIGPRVLADGWVHY